METAMILVVVLLICVLLLLLLTGEIYYTLHKMLKIFEQAKEKLDELD